MKKFVLINSPLFWERTDEEEEYLSPLGLGYIATYYTKSKLRKAQSKTFSFSEFFII